MRWLMITRKLDPADNHVGFVVGWVRALAARLDDLDVICQETAQPALPDNVRAFSMGKEAGAGRLAQAWRFTQHLRALTPEIDGFFCHMIPRYVLFAAPWARVYRKPLLLWYTHRQISPELRLASALATRIMTASPGSFPLRSSRLAVMGHGIDASLFPPSQVENDPLEIVLVARLARIKRQDWLLRAASQVMARGDVRPFRVLLVGGPVEGEPDTPAELERLAAQLDPAPTVAFVGPLAHSQVADVIRGCAFAVNLSPPGLFDKAALESMLAGKPTLVVNPDFLSVLGEAADILYLPEDADADAMLRCLADRLARLLAMSPEERAALGMLLRERTLAAHSLDGLMDRMVTLMREAASHA
ncbi:MAG TPA: glycosyltransferase family 4 protein [Aggregatilineaceae bacterium]|jgi:glycosyltransferase involved in cell wall biosynthesis|nr:glycosyltransferase family 4 protein [Aggregatilineaceae bacterium]